MSDLPQFIGSTSSSNPRRRHHQHYQVDIDSAESATSTTSLVNFSKGISPSSARPNRRNPIGSSSVVPPALDSKKFDDVPSYPPQPPASSSFFSVTPFQQSTASFPNFSSFIAAPAAQIWNSAQNFAEQYSQTIDFESRTNLATTSQQEADTFDQEFDNFTLLEMPFRDRTSEFRTVTKSFLMKYQANGVQNKDEREQMIRASIQFNQLAKRIGRDLSATCAKMEKLTQLAKKKSLFQDHSGEVEELSSILKQDITGLNKQIANLQEIAKQRSGGGTFGKHQGKDHSKLVVVGLQSKLADVSTSFQNVLGICTENLKLKKNRREKFSQPACVPSTLPPSASTGNKGSILLQEDVMSSGSSSVAVDMDRLEQQRMQDQLSLIDESEAYHRDRFNAMESIESSISELGTIFRQLALLVSEQGEMITRIDSNVEETSMNVEAAHHELLKYFNNISKNRWLIIKVFGVLMAFFVFFVIFMT